MRRPHRRLSARLPAKPICHKCAVRSTVWVYPVNSPKPLPQNNLCTATLSLLRAIDRQNAGAEIPFLRTKIPFQTRRSPEYGPTSVHQRSYYTAGSTADFASQSCSGRPPWRAAGLKPARSLEGQRSPARLMPGAYLRTVVQVLQFLFGKRG